MSKFHGSRQPAWGLGVARLGTSVLKHRASNGDDRSGSKWCNDAWATGNRHAELLRAIKRARWLHPSIWSALHATWMTRGHHSPLPVSPPSLRGWQDIQGFSGSACAPRVCRRPCRAPRACRRPCRASRACRRPCRAPALVRAARSFRACAAVSRLRASAAPSPIESQRRRGLAQRVPPALARMARRQALARRSRLELEARARLRRRRSTTPSSAPAASTSIRACRRSRSATTSRPPPRARRRPSHSAPGSSSARRIGSPPSNAG